MPRKLRLEFPGAVYHVINRGNYRADIFRGEKTRAAFEKCLFEACTKSGWVLHAYVLMRNHFHLALETPQGNLVPGMQWLQATFANRFNRLRGERGHLFQGRYKALLVEPGAALGQLCHYIHLNPVRARVVPVARLGEYRYSSYRYLLHPAERPAFLRNDTALTEAGALADNPAGWTAYEKYLEWQAAEGPAGKTAAYVSLSRGWVLGSREFKEKLLKGHQLHAESRAWETKGKHEIRELRWENALRSSLRVLHRTRKDLTCGRVSQPWKTGLAVFLKERTQASNAWLAHHLGASHAAYLSRLASAARRQSPPNPTLATLRAKCTT